jgi:hypothetical protein
VLVSSALEDTDLLIQLSGNVREPDGFDELGALRWAQELAGELFESVSGIIRSVRRFEGPVRNLFLPTISLTSLVVIEAN